MLKQLSDKLNNVFYKGPDLKNMMETLDNFRRSATWEEKQLKENDGKVNLKENLWEIMPKNGSIFHFLILYDSFDIELQIVTFNPKIQF